MSKVCKFFLQGNCKYGSSCRFYHSDRTRSNYQYSSEYQAKHKNVSLAYEDSNRYHNDYDKKEQHKYYQHGIKSNNYYSTNDYNSRNNNNNKDTHQSQNGRNVKNFYKEYNHDEDTVRNFNRKSYQDKNELENQYKNEKNQDAKYNKVQLNSNKNLEETMDYKQHIQDTIAQIENYDKEIKILKSQIKNMANCTVWPLTCFHPIGNTYPIQPVGILNFPDVSFEELRCDYYVSKNISADTGLIHKKLYEALLLKVQQQKEMILSLTNIVKNDMIATFDKCQQSKVDPKFQNTIDVDQNTYWNMSINHMKTSEDDKKIQLDSFSFSIDNKVGEPETDCKSSSLKIFLQTDVYGTVDCDEFAQENFTDFVPILPPPKKFCM